MKANNIFLAMVIILKADVSMELTKTSLKPRVTLTVNSTSTSIRTEVTKEVDDKRKNVISGNSHQRYVDNSRNKRRSITPSNKMDRTIIGAIVIGSIFLFITISITVTVIIFCLKKNTVFVFQKSEQEDVNDCTYDDCVDAISCQSYLHYFDRPCSAGHSTQSAGRGNCDRPFVSEYLEHCPAELFYPMHYDRPCPAPFNQLPKNSQTRCRCRNFKHQVPLETALSTPYPFNRIVQDPSIWDKIHEGSHYRPLFTEQPPVPTQPCHVDDFKVTLDFIANRRVVTANPPDKGAVDNHPLLQEFSRCIQNNPSDNSSQILLTPLGKSQTYTELHPNSVSSDGPVEKPDHQMGTKLTKSTSTYDSRVKNNRKY